MGTACSTHVNSASSFFQAAPEHFSQCKRTVEGLLVDPAVERLARSLDPGSHWALDVSYDDQDLCCCVGWRPRATTLELVCILFGHNGRKLGELSSHFVPFVRNKIRYEKVFDAGTTGGGWGENLNGDDEPPVGLPSDDRFKVHFRLRDFEDDLHVICFALRAPDRQRLCDARGVYARMVEKSNDRADKLVCLAHTGHLPVLSNNCVILATLARNQESQEWNFESIGLCLPGNLLEKWMRQPWCIDPDAEDTQSKPPSKNTSIEKQRSTVEMVNEIAQLEEQLQKLKAKETVEHIKAGFSPDSDKKIGLHVADGNISQANAANKAAHTRGIHVGVEEGAQERKERRRKKSINEQHAWGEAGRIGDIASVVASGPRAHVEPMTHFDMYDPVSPTVPVRNLARTPGDPDDDLYLACQSDDEEQKLESELQQNRNAGLQQRALNGQMNFGSSETVLHEAFPRGSEPSPSSDHKATGSSESRRGSERKSKSVSFSGDSAAAGASAKELAQMVEMEKAVHQPEQPPTAPSSSSSSSPPRGSLQPRGSRQEPRGSTSSSARGSSAGLASSPSQGSSTATASDKPDSSTASNKPDSGTSSASAAPSAAASSSSSAAQAPAQAKRHSSARSSNAAPIEASATTSKASSPAAATKAGGVSTGAAVAGGAVAGAAVAATAVAATSEDDEIRQLMRMSKVEDAENLEQLGLDDEEYYYDEWEEGEEEEYYEGEEEEDDDLE